MTTDLKIFGEHDENTVKQMWNCMGVGSVAGGTLCADGHVGYAQPVGGVIAYEDHISISGVGYDIACGNMAVKTDMTRDDIRGRENKIAKDIQKKINFGVGGTYTRSRNDNTRDLEIWDSPLWADADVEYLKDMAIGQLGTVGGGNHYVDLFTDNEGYIWIGNHFGSRGLGHKTATKYMKAAGAKDGMFVAPAVVDPSTELGQRYLAGMDLAGQYAYAGREWVIQTIKKIFAAKILDSVHNHHNFAWREKHGDREYWVVRKGATPAFPGQRGFVGGSMGDNAVIIRGIDSELSRQSWYSTVHGAGRLFGRRAAKESFTRHEMEKWVNDRGIMLFGADVDESPMAYRRLDEVLRFHEGTVEIEHVLTPFMVFMAPKGVRDPYKD